MLFVINTSMIIIKFFIYIKKYILYKYLLVISVNSFEIIFLFRPDMFIK